MGELAERIYFAACRTLGKMLRSSRYATAQVVEQDGVRRVRKRRRFYAPVLVQLGGPLVRLLNTGMRVLPQRAWVQRERELYQQLRGTTIEVGDDGALILPCLPGKTLATLLDDPALPPATRNTAIVLAVNALRQFHQSGFTHGDAMAENVLIDLSRDVAHWFDFETMHDAARSIAWRRADDLRALLATCLLRTAPSQRAQTLQLILDAYDDAEVDQLLARQFETAWRRPLTFHLGQAPLTFRTYREIARLLQERMRT